MYSLPFCPRSLEFKLCLVNCTRKEPREEKRIFNNYLVEGTWALGKGNFVSDTNTGEIMDKSVYGTPSDVGFRRTWGSATDQSAPPQGPGQDVVKGPKRDADGKLELALAGPRGDIQLEEHLNSVRVLDGLGSGGYACSACSLSFPDSDSYLAHLNSRKHQMALGQSMRVERSSAEQVRARIAYWKKKLSEAPEGA